MKNYSKTSAQTRVDQIRRFQEELATLQSDSAVNVDEGFVTEVSAYHQDLLAQLEKDFDVDVSDESKRLSTGMTLASFLGALAMAASVFFLFYQYWGYLGVWQQVGILASAPLITLIAAVLVRGKEKSGYYSKLLALISFSCFVLNISMLGQIFNLPSSPNAFLIWSVYALLLAYAMDLRLMLGMGILSFYGFLSAKVGMWCGIYWVSFGDYPENFLLPALLAFMIPVVFDHSRFENFDSIYRIMSSVAFLLVVLVLSHWGVGSYAYYFHELDPDVIEGVYQVLGFLISASLVWLGIKKSWTDQVAVGNVFFVVFLYSKFFDWWWDWMPKFIFFFVIGLTSVLILMVFNRLRKVGLIGGEQ